MAGGDLDVSQRHPGVESGHDESGSQHVRVHESESGPFADGPDPPVGGAAVQTLTIATPQDRAVVTFTDGEIDGAGGPRDERDRCWLVALTDDAQGPVASLYPEVFDIGGTGLGHPQPV